MQKTAVEDAKNDQFRPHGPLTVGAFEALLEQANEHHLFGLMHLTGDGDEEVTLTFVDGLIAVRPEPGSTDASAAKSAMADVLHDLTKDGGYTGWYRCEPIIGDGDVQDLHRYKPLALLAMAATGLPAGDGQSGTDPEAGATTTSTEASSDEAPTTTPPANSADVTTTSSEPARIGAKSDSKADLSFNRKLEKALAKIGENPVEDFRQPAVRPRPKPEPRPVIAERRKPISEADISAEPDRTLGAPTSPVGPLTVDGEATNKNTTNKNATDKSNRNKDTAVSDTDSDISDDSDTTGKGKPMGPNVRGRLIRGLGS